MSSTSKFIRYIVEKGVNLEIETDNKLRPIHLVCKNSTSEMIRYIIEKGVILETHTVSRPIHYGCHFF